MPTFVDGPVGVTVPATSANLGPGFDSLGLALSLRDDLEAEVLPEGLVVEVEGAGAEGLPRDESHLVVRAMRAAFELMGEQPPGLRLSCRNVIPHARGLGSSSAAIVAGVVLARALVAGGQLLASDDALFDLAADLEGHPDNVAPAFYGGFVISGRENGRWYAVRASTGGWSARGSSRIRPHGPRRSTTRRPAIPRPRICPSGSRPTTSSTRSGPIPGRACACCCRSTTP
jgi:homoserine kinase